MPGSRERYRRARDGGQAQGGDPRLRELLRREIRAALQPEPRGLSGTGHTQRPQRHSGTGSLRRPEWTCSACSATNWLDRTHCRHGCEAKSTRAPAARPAAARPTAARPTASQPAPAAPAARGPRKAWADQEDEEDKEKAKTAEAADSSGTAARTLAPEERAAQTEAQAAALEGSAASLRQHGLAERAAELKAEAAQLRKRTPALAPGRRLDEAEGYLRRCQRRAEKSAEATAAAEASLEEAKRLQARADAAAREADEQLQKLRKDLAGASDSAMPDADAAEDSAAKLAELRALLRRTEGERDAAHLAAGRPPTEPQTALSREAEAELRALLAEAQRTFAEALANGAATAQQAGELAVLTAQADAASTKRRRVRADAGSGASTPRTPR